MKLSLKQTQEHVSGIAGRYGVNVTFLLPDASEFCGLDNGGLSIEGNITLGVFHCPIFMVAVLYHELGHHALSLLPPSEIGYNEERLCWTWALTKLKQDGNKIPYSVLKHCIHSLNFYKSK